ncbi:sugar ABC transporter substrate-binding protein [Paenibacillus chondroitinus]|uniref:Sugar ABC transporter substrate-binding protein n=1 Tax=Paenibacillus chondroitinus TaxID=59842 RepID=A0ABU6DBY1_9BACL|nr:MULTISPECIES: sugar ABC transporter substrate-binding protein [Paenibacillus]MCY9656441.1 sugar ABC transporter substrate-binding protein [Paenibacillus anseongense]MEB4795265.1 sugar ABC transporter substrate-binding protein [Paenibacillus chondroitinus]
MKKLAITLLSSALVLTAAAGCAKTDEKKNAGNAPAATTGSKEKVELTWWVDARGDVKQVYDDIKAGFEKANPNVKINMVVTPDDKINERISVAANTNEVPDIQQGSFFWPLSYAKKGLLVPLDDMIDKQDFEEKTLKSVSVDNKVFIYPNSTVAIGLLVNKDLFKEKGALDLLPQNMQPWSSEQFLKAAKAVTDPSKQTYGYGLYAGDSGGDQGTHSILWGFGAKTWNDDDTKATLNSPEGVKGLEFLTKLTDEGVVPPGAAGLKATAVFNDMFVQGKLGMAFGNIGNLPTLNKAFAEGNAKKFDVDIVPFPSVDGKSSNTVLFGYGTWMWNTKNEVKMKWAKEFVKFANNPENMGKMTQAESVIVARKSLAKSYEAGTMKSKTIELFKYAGDIGVSVPGYPQTRAAFYPEVQAALTKAKTAQQALDDWVKKSNDIIAASSK